MDGGKVLRNTDGSVAVDTNLGKRVLVSQWAVECRWIVPERMKLEQDRMMIGRLVDRGGLIAGQEMNPEQREEIIGRLVDRVPWEGVCCRHHGTRMVSGLGSSGVQVVLHEPQVRCTIEGRY